MAWQILDNDGMIFNKEKGVQFIDLAPAEVTRWQNAIAPLRSQIHQGHG